MLVTRLASSKKLSFAKSSADRRNCYVCKSWIKWHRKDLNNLTVLSYLIDGQIHERWSHGRFHLWYLICFHNTVSLQNKKNYYYKEAFLYWTETILCFWFTYLSVFIQGLGYCGLKFRAYNLILCAEPNVVKYVFPQSTHSEQKRNLDNGQV